MLIAVKRAENENDQPSIAGTFNHAKGHENKIQIALNATTTKRMCQLTKYVCYRNEVDLQDIFYTVVF